MALQWFPTLVPALNPDSNLGRASRVLPFSAKAIRSIHEKLLPMIISISTKKLKAIRASAHSKRSNNFVPSEPTIDAEEDKYPQRSMGVWRVLGAITAGLAFALIGVGIGVSLGFAGGGPAAPVAAAIIGGTMLAGGLFVGAVAPELGFAGLQMVGTVLSLPFALALDAINALTFGALANVFKPKLIKLKAFKVDFFDDLPLAETACPIFDLTADFNSAHPASCQSTAAMLMAQSAHPAGRDINSLRASSIANATVGNQDTSSLLVSSFLNPSVFSRADARSEGGAVLQRNELERTDTGTNSPPALSNRPGPGGEVD